MCIPVGNVCDDKPDCPGGTDETNTTAQQTCGKPDVYKSRTKNSTIYDNIMSHLPLI